MSDKVARAVFLWVYFSLIAVGIFFVACGCESASVNNRDLLDYIPSMPDTKPSPLPDQLPSNLIWKGASYANAMPDQNAQIRSAAIDQNKAYYDLTIPADWAIKTVKVKVQAIICIGYEQNGNIVIGKYDWMRVGGQAVKGLENIHNGYNGLSMPLTGVKCYAMVVSVDGKRRSGLVEMNWK